MSSNNPLIIIAIAPIIGALIGCPIGLGLGSILNAYSSHQNQSQNQIVATPHHEQPPANPSPSTTPPISAYTNDCPVCALDGENCAYQCPFCKKGDHSIYTHRDPSKYFICPVCHCYHKAPKELIRQFRVLLKAQEQQAALFPQTQAPSENNP